MNRIWVPGDDERTLRPRPATGDEEDDRTVKVVLKGGPYGEAGKPVRIRKDCKERMVVIAAPTSRLLPGRAATVQRWYFVPSSEPGVWRPRQGEEVSS